MGKTTTKDMVAAVLGEKYRVLKTEGNLNNEIGVPMTLLRLSGEHEIAVLELGMNHAGEIDYLSALVEPDVVLMTNIGDSHIEHFGSREKILEAKSEIFHHVKSGAFVVINGDDPLLNTLPGKLPYAFTRVGAGEGLDYRAEGLVSDGKSHMTCEVKTPHNSFRGGDSRPGRPHDLPHADGGGGGGALWPDADADCRRRAPLCPHQNAYEPAPPGR